MKSPFKISSRQLLFPALAFTMFSGLVCMPAPAKKNQDPRLAEIKLPEGFSIDIYASVPNARSMALGDKGTLFVGNRSGSESVYAVVDRDGNFQADTVYQIAMGMNEPNGIAFRDGSLFVAEINKVVRWDNIEDRLENPGNPVVVTDGLPSDKHHGWKYLALGPDGKLYVPVGAPCNICDRPDDPRYASILRMDPDGSNMEVYASGVRNTVGFDFHPVTGALWFTDNGRDWLGNDSPADELNHAPEAGMHFGFPYCHAGSIADPEYGKEHPCNQYTPPVQNLGPHVAALGMHFYRGKMFPKEYQGKVLICEHGSWNRDTPIGYRVSMVSLDGDKSLGYKVFAQGWLSGNSAWGRPVDLLELPDGSLLVSDDAAGKVYRISYQ